MSILTPGNYTFLLNELAKHRGNYLEIGVYEGEAVRGLALKFPEKTIYAIDPFIADFGTDGHAGVPIGARLEVQRDIALANWNHIPNIKFFEQTSVSFAQEKTDEELAAMNLSVVYVDGAHDTGNALNDLILAGRALSNGGLILIDDSSVPSVQAAIETFVAQNRERLSEPIEFGGLRLRMKPTHDSIRGWFAAALHDQMARNDAVWCLTGDLGYGMLNTLRDDFPDRFVNVGASEQLLLGAGIGLALEGKIPFCYSITTFLLYRPFEWIRNYVNHEKIPVRLVGSGMENDYAHDGITHQPSLKELNLVFAAFRNIETYMPEDKESVPTMVDKMVMRNEPSFICLRR